MKKLTALLLVLTLVMSLAACNRVEPEPSTDPSAASTTEPTTEPTEAPTTEPTIEPTTENTAVYLEKCRQALEELQNRDYVVLNEWKSTDDPDIMLAWLTAKYVHSRDDWAISKLMDPVTTFYYMEADGVQYVRYHSEHPDTAYPYWTVADLSAPEHEFSDDCWIMEYQWDPDKITYQSSKSKNSSEIITLNLIDTDTGTNSGLLELQIDQDGHLENVTKTMYSNGTDGQTYELTSKVEVYSTWDNLCEKYITDYLYQTTAEYRYQMVLHEEWNFRIVGCVFENPEDISLDYLFYLGLPMEEREDYTQFSQAEVDFLKDKLKDTLWGEDNWVNANKFPANRLDEILNQYLGISLDDVEIPELWYYFSETDSYYDVRTDAYSTGKITVTEVEEAEDGILRIHYEVQGHILDQTTGESMINPEMLITMRVTDEGGHQVVSNVIDPDSTYYLLYTSGLDRLFQTGAKVYIDNNKAKPIRVISVNKEIIHGLLEHLNHYNWQKIDGPIGKAEKDPFQEQIYFRNQGTFDQGINLTLTVWEDGSYQLGYWDNLETTCYYCGTPKSDTYGSAAEDLRNFHETYWPESDE